MMGSLRLTLGLVLVASLATTPAAGQQIQAMRAIVLDFPASQAEVDDWFLRNTTRLQALASRVTFFPGYPMVVAGQQLPALGPVRFAVIAGVCAQGEGPAFAALSEHFPGAVLRNVRLPPDGIACPTVNQVHPGAPVKLPSQTISLDGLVISEPVSMGMAPDVEVDPPEDLDEEDEDESWPVLISPRLFASAGPRLGSMDRAQALRAMFPGLVTQARPDQEGRTEIVEVQTQVAPWLSFPDPDSYEPPEGSDEEELRPVGTEAMAVLAKVRSDMGDGEWMTSVVVAVIGKRQGRPAVLARLDGAEFDTEAMEDDFSRVDWRLGKRGLAPGLFALQIVVRGEEREEQNRVVNEEALLFAVEGRSLFQVAGFLLSSLDEGREHEDGRLTTWQTASRSKVQALPDPDGPLYRLRLDVQTTEKEDGRVIANERDRTELCFVDGEYMDCGESEQDELEGTLGPDGLYVR